LITHALAEKHEALWLRLVALHKDIMALGAKKPGAPVSEPVRIQAEGLLSDCCDFNGQKRARLAVAAADLGGLAVQLGQALAIIEAWESRHTRWDERFDCRMWRVPNGNLPVKRLKPPSLAMAPPRRDMADLRAKLALRIDQRSRYIYETGFAAGRAARLGAPEQETYPRLRQID
jgi:hypothetical protein